MKCSVVVRAGCVLLSPRFLERTGIPGAMLVKIRTPAEARGWDKSRTPTDHELPRDFPEGAFAMSALGIKERQDGRPPDLTAPRGRHEDATPPRPWSHGRAAMSHARRGRNVDLRKGGNKHRHENGGDSTGRDGVCNPHRWVGVHDFVTHRSVGGWPRLGLFGARKLLFRPLSVGWLTRFGMPAGGRRRSVAKMGSRSIRSSVITDVAPAASAMTRRLRAPYSVGTECDNGAGTVLSERRPSRGRSAPPELKFETSVDR